MLFPFFSSMHDRPGDKQTPDIKNSVSIFKIVGVLCRSPKWSLLKGNYLRFSVPSYSFIFWIDSDWIPVLTLLFCVFIFNLFFNQRSITEKHNIFQANKFFIKKKTHQSRTVSSTVRKIIPNIDMWTEYALTFYRTFLLKNMCLELCIYMCRSMYVRLKVK